MSNSFKTAMIALSSIIINPLNPRKTFNEASIEELANSIAVEGLMHNLVVRPAGDQYEIVAGERRYRALRRLVERGDLKESHKVACQVRELDDAQALTLALSENEKREDVHPMEQSEGYLRLTKEPFHLTAADLAVRTGAAESTIALQLALADKLSDTGRLLYLLDRIDLSQARALCLMSAQRQEEFLAEHAGPKYAEEDYYQVSGEEAEAEGFVIHPDAQPDTHDGYWIPKDDAELYPEADVPEPRDIKKAATQGMIPLSRALFPLERYYAEKGTTSGIPVLGVEFFDNPDLFKRLQRSWMENEVKKQLSAEGWLPYIEDKEPSYNHFGYRRENLATVYMNDGGEVIIRKNFGPIVEEKRVLEQRQKAAGAAGSGTEKQNRVRIRLEDKAFNRAAESELMKSFHHALQFLIMSMVGQDGSRLRVEHLTGNPHEGYHDPVALERVAAFRAEVEAAGAKVSNVGTKEDDPLFTLGYGSGEPSRAAIVKVLEAKTNEELEQLSHALIVLTLKPVADGVFSPAYAFATRFGSNPMDFFTPDREYLDACNLTEIERDILPTLGRPVMGTKKKDLVAEITISHRAAYAQYVPPRMRPATPATPATDEAEEVPGELVEA